MPIAAILLATVVPASVPTAPVALTCEENLAQTDGHGVTTHQSWHVDYVIDWARTRMSYKAPWGQGTLLQNAPGILHFINAPDGYTIFAQMLGPGQYIHQSVTRFSHDWSHAVYGGNDHLRGIEIKRTTGTLDCRKQRT